jgi:hypothetical protein
LPDARGARRLAQKADDTAPAVVIDEMPVDTRRKANQSLKFSCGSNPDFYLFAAIADREIGADQISVLFGWQAARTAVLTTLIVSAAGSSPSKTRSLLNRCQRLPSG